MKKKVLFSLLALTATLCADGEVIADANMMKDQQKKQSQTQMNNQSMMNMAILTSARPDSENGWFLFADALYWYVDIGSTDWANANSNTTPVTTTNATNHSLNFKWDWGFKVGIGVNVDHDMWDSRVYYTWFDTKHHNHVGGGAGVTVADQIGVANAVVAALPVAGSLTTGTTDWNFHFSMFDWDLGRWQYFSKNLALRPYVGVKGGWIHTKVKSTFVGAGATAVASVSESFKNNYWGVGPSAGINTLWVLGFAGSRMDHRFSLFGDFGGALQYGHFNVTSQSAGVNTGAGTALTGLNQTGLNRNMATAMLQGAMGISWDTSFNRDRCHFMLKLGYELQYWFRQNQLIGTAYDAATGLASNFRFSDDMALQGATAEVRFDF